MSLTKREQRKGKKKIAEALNAFSGHPSMPSVLVAMMIEYLGMDDLRETVRIGLMSKEDQMSERCQKKINSKGLQRKLQLAREDVKQTDQVLYFMHGNPIISIVLSDVRWSLYSDQDEQQRVLEHLEGTVEDLEMKDPKILRQRLECVKARLNGSYNLHPDTVGCLMMKKVKYERLLSNKPSKKQRQKTRKKMVASRESEETNTPEPVQTFCRPCTKKIAKNKGRSGRLCPKCMGLKKRQNV
jgi:hypothetical protein